MWQTIATVALTSLVTLVVGFLWNFFLNRTKRAIHKKQEVSKQLLKEVVEESLKPVRERLDKIDADNSLLKKGIQSELRMDLRSNYNMWIKKGYAPSNEREDLEYLYLIYHNLGKNGVMDDLRDKFLNLPLEKPNKK